MPRIRKTLSLAGVMFRTFQFTGLFRSDKNGKNRTGKNRAALVLLLFLGFSLVPFVFSCVSILTGLYDVLRPSGSQSLILGSSTSAVALLIFVFGFTNVLAVFYHAGDTERYLAYPVKPTEILAAKFITTLLYEYILCACILLPIYCVYGIKSAAGPLYYLYSLLAGAMLPVIPLALSAAVIMLLMRFTRIFRNRDVVNTVSMFLLLTFVLIFQFLTTRLSSYTGFEDQMLQSFIGKLQSISGSIGNVFIGTGFLRTALDASGTFAGFGNLLAYAGCTGIVFFLFLLLGKALYFKGVHGLRQMPPQKKISLSQIDKKIRAGHIWGALIKKDLRIMLRTPVFFFNNIFMIFFIPLFFGLFFIMQNTSGGPEMDFLRTLPFSLRTAASSITFFVAMAAGALVGSTNKIAGSILSREGSGFNHMKTIPVPYRLQIAAKVGLGYMASILSSAILLAVLAVFLKIPLLFLPFLLVPLLLGALLPNLVGALAELYSPKLHWNSEQTAVRQNMNTLFEVLSGFALVAISILAGILLVQKTGLLPLPAFLLCTALGILCNLPVYLLIHHALPLQMEKLYR